MANEQAIKANNIVTLPEGEGTQLSFTSADVKGMMVSDRGELVITLQSGDTLTVTNFEALAQKSTTLTLADGTAIETRALFEKLLGEMPAQVIATPDANKIVEYTMQPGRKYQFDFEKTGTESIEQKDGSLVITFDNGSTVVLKNYAAAMDADLSPELSFNGEFMSLQEFAEALRLATMIDEGMERPQTITQPQPPQTVDAKVKDVSQGEQDLAALAQQLAGIEPAAGNAGSAGAGGRGGMGFQSNVSSVALGSIVPQGPIGRVEYQWTTPEFTDELPYEPGDPVNPPPAPLLSGQDAQVYEDGSVTLVIGAQSQVNFGVVTTVVVSGIPSNWTVVPNGGTYDPNAGTITYIVPPGVPFTGGPTLSPPGDSDADIPVITITATTTDTETGLSSTSTKTITVTTDAVADEPNINALDDSGQEGQDLDVDVTTSVKDTDGSETITSIVIKGLPVGFDLSAGTRDPVTGDWTLTPAELAGLKVTPPAHFVGKLDLIAVSTATETNKTDNDFDLGNDTNTKEDPFTLTWLPNPPTVTVDFPPGNPGDPNDPDPNSGTFDADNAWVKEDKSVDIVINASLRAGHGADEVLTVTVTGINAAWGFNPNGVGTYNSNTGTWTVTLPPGQNLIGHALTFTPPANSDVDLSGLVATSSAYVPATNTTSVDSEGFGIVVDAVADAPSVDAKDASGNENTAIALDIKGMLGMDTDGSESITGYKITGVPNNYSFNQGTNLGNGEWSFTPAQITGLTISAPANTFGSITLNAVVLTSDTPTDIEPDTADNTAQATDPFTVTWKPVVNPPDILVNNGVDNAQVLEDGTVNVPITATLGAGGSGNEILTVTVTGIDPNWGFNPNGVGTYNPATGTWTVTLPPGQNLNNHILTFAPPADSDIDLTNLVATATAFEPATNTSAADTDGFNVVVDAVADEPNIVAQDDSGKEDEVLDVVISTAVTDTDGSETITSIVIKGIPAGFQLSAGVRDVVTGDWTLTPAQLTNLKITPPADYVGVLNLTAISTATETNKSGGEFNTANDNATKSDDFTLTWLPNPPTITVDFPPNHAFDANNALVKEDTSVDVIINANLRAGHGPNEVLTVTVTGIDANWGFNPNGVGTYNSATGTWTVTLPPGQNLTGHHLTFTPPANSDIDLSGLMATSSAYVPATNTTLSDSESFGIVVDAVADAPSVDAKDVSGNENTAITLDIKGLLGDDTDGSESITGYQISGVEAGYSFNQGTNLGGGIWSFTPAQIVGLKISAPANKFGSINLTAKVLTADTPTDLEADTSDNTAQATDPFTVTWKPTVNEPNILVNGGVDNAIVKEDGSVGVSIVANLGAGHSPTEVLTVTVTGIHSSWGFSAPVGTYNAATGTWTITLPPGQDLPSTIMTFRPPANSDLDLSGLVATATAREPATNTTANATDNFRIITDAVADAPTLNAGADKTVEEGKSVALNISTAVTDNDGSEIIESIVITGLPPGATLSAGAYHAGTDSWTLTPAQLVGLRINVADGTQAKNYTITVKSTALDTNTATAGANIEVTTADNRATATDTLILCVTKDDVPNIIDPAAKVVDETNLKNGNQVVGGTINVQYGADTPANSGLELNNTFGSSVPLTSNGAAVNVTRAGNVWTGKTAAGAEIFTLTLNATTGQYTFTLKGTLDHPVKGSTAAAHNDGIDLSFGVTATDSDGDTDTSTIRVQVLDDGPKAVDDVKTYNVGTTNVTGGVLANDTQSQDMPNKVTKIAFGGTVKDVPGTGSVAIDGEHGKLTIKADGTYTYTPFSTANHVTTKTVAMGLASGDATGTQTSITKNGIVVSIGAFAPGNGATTNGNDLVWVNEGAGQGIGINGNSSTKVTNGETLVVNPNQLASEVKLTLADIGANNAGNALSFRLHFEDGTSTVVKKVVPAGGVPGGLWNLTFDGVDYGGKLIDKVDIFNNKATDGNVSFLLNNVTVKVPVAAVDPSDDFVYTLTDADGDTATATLNIDGKAQRLIIGGNTDDKTGKTADHYGGGGEGKIVGGAYADILIGDTGGSSMVAQTKDYNVVLVLDTSGSMGVKSNANSRLSLLIDAVENLLKDFNEYTTGTIKVHIVPFSTNLESAGTFTVTGGQTGLNNALTFLNNLQEGGRTNYEAALKGAITYLNGSGPIAGADTYTYFVTDGAPNDYLNNSGQVVNNDNATTAMNQIRGTDGSNEIQQIQNLSTKVIGIGIEIGNTGTAIDRISEIDSTGKAINVNDAADLTSALSNLSPLNILASSGGDEIEGGAGDDIIFGDSVYTDLLAVAQGLGTSKGAGWAVFDKLEDGQGTNAAWSRTDTINYIRNNANEVGRETLDSASNTRTGGNDVLSGGAGNDLIYGQNGDDILIGGAGNDTLIGGSGKDTFRYTAGDNGLDTIKDFSIAQGDKLDLSQLLSGHGVVQSAIDDFVFTRVQGGNTIVSVDLNGSGNAASAVDLTVLEGVNTNLTALLNANAIITT